jgi:hypothetical protein
MSIFASRTTQTIPIPWDGPHTVTIRRLAGRHLERARQAEQVNSMKAVERLGGEQFRRALNDAGGGDPAAVAALVAERRADPLFGLDRYTVLAHGIVSWTYDEPLDAVATVDDEGQPQRRIPALDDLDDDAADLIARAIVALSPRRDQAAQKNG